jgi:hydroxypyruvate isomerase
MAKLAVCIEPFFPDLPYAERLARVRRLGFRHYEFWFLDKRFDGKTLIDEKKNLEELAECNARYGLTCTDFVFNHPDGGVVAALIDKRDHGKLLDTLEGIIEQGRRVGVKAFISGSGNKVAGLRPEEAVENMVAGLKACAPILAKHGATLLLEPWNTRVDHPHNFLDDPRLSVEVLKKVGSPAVKLLYDIYHMQIMAGDVTAFIRENIGYIGHFHAAGVPGRHEPDACELNYPFILKELDRLGYQGCVGLEYWPTMDHAASLKRTKKYLET